MNTGEASMLFYSSYVLVWILSAFHFLALFVITRQIADLRNLLATQGVSTNGLPVGSRAPAFTAVDLLSGNDISSKGIEGRRVVLCFLSTECSTCRLLARELARCDRTLLDGLIIYSNADEVSCRRVFATTAEKVPVLRRLNIDVAAQFHIASFPTAVVIDSAGTITEQRTPGDLDELLGCISPEPRRTTSRPRAAMAWAGDGSSS